MSEHPYRATGQVPAMTSEPVCAECCHLTVQAPGPRHIHPKHWECGAHVVRIKLPTVHPVTGERKPERPVLRKCEDVNGDGQCDRFAPMTLRVWLSWHSGAVFTTSLVLLILCLFAFAAAL